MAKPLINVFISYAPGDAVVVDVFKNGIHQHLPLSTRFQFEIDDPAELLAGASWKNEISERLASCDVAILCISASFLNLESDQIKELADLLKQGNKKVVIPVYLKQCMFQAWEAECGIGVYKPSGVNYNKGEDENFAFCDLVTVTEAEGRITTIADKRIDRYFMDLAQQLEHALTGGKSEAMAPNVVEPAAKTEYINEINYPYFDDTNFFGREHFLTQVHEKLNTRKLPLLLSGIGGMGKTATAIAYGQLPDYAAAYQYIGWVNVTDDLFNSLFSTFKGNAILPFEYDPGGNRDKDTENFMQLLKKTNGNNLLVIDNVNNEKDIDTFINNWMRYKPGWKCIITTRTDNKAYQDHLLALPSLSPEEAEQLFLKYNPSDDFDKESFLNLYAFTGGHTFVIELLAKYAESSSTIKNTRQLVEHLMSKGIKALNLAVKAKQGQQQQADKKVSDFLFGLYDPFRLQEKEQEYIRYFSVLPASENDFEKLVYLFGIKEEDVDSFDATLRTLSKEGWLTCTKKGFFLQQMIGQICREKLMPDEQNCTPLLNALYSLMSAGNLTGTIPYFELAYSIVNYIKDTTEEYANMLMKLSDLSKAYGNMTFVIPLLESATTIFQNYNLFKYGISLEKTGDAYMIQKYNPENRAAALKVYLKYSETARLLCNEEPEQTRHQHILAVSHFKLGEVYRYEDNMKEAINYYNKSLERVKLLAEYFPEVPHYSHMISITYGIISEILAEHGYTTESEELFSMSFEMQKQIAEKNPEDFNSRYLLGLGYAKLGDLAEKSGQIAKALEYFELYFDSIESLAAEKKDNIMYQGDLAKAYLKLANLSEGGEKNELLLKAKEICNLLMEKMPENPDFYSIEQHVNKRLIQQGLIDPES